MKKFIWYFFVIFTSIVLLIAFVQKSVIATVTAVILCVFLKKIEKKIDNYNLYKQLGILNKFINKI